MKKINLSILCLFLVFSLKSSELPRVALIPLDDEARNAADLTLPRTGSSLPKWVFLERSEIEKISKEFKLSASALTDEDFSLDPGRIENTDIFGIVGSIDGKLRFIAFDAKTGIRLIDVDIQGKNIEGRAEKINGLLASAVDKRLLEKGKKIRKFGFVPLVTANLPPEHAKFAREAERMLIREIGSLPDAVVLERRYLGALLKEPNAEEKQLAQDLAASSLVVRLTASPGKDGKIRLTAEFTASGGKQTLSLAECQLDPKGELRAQLRGFIGSQKLDFSKTDNSEFRSQEASNFARQADFALQHFFSQNAVASAEAAATLDKKQELALCATYATACENAWGNWGSAPKDKMADVVKNLKGAVDIAGRKNVFPPQLCTFIRKWGYVSKATFDLLPPDITKEMREVCDDYFAARHENLKPLIDRADRGGDSVALKLAALDARGEYIHTMGQEADQYWNYGYLGKYVQPQMDLFNRETHELLPELEKFFATPADKRPAKYPIAEGKEDVGYRNRHGTFLGGINILEQSFVGDFHNRDLNTLSGYNREIVQKFLKTMEDSPLVVISVKGLRGLRMMDEKTARNQKETAEINHELYGDFSRKLQECIQTKALIGDYALDGGYFNLMYDPDFLDFPARLAIWNSAIERYHYYHIFRGNIIHRFEEKLSFEETSTLYKTINANFERWQNDPLATGRKQTYIADEFKNNLKALAKKYPQFNPAFADLPKSPYSQVVTPLTEISKKFYPMGAAFEDGIIYTSLIPGNEKDKTTRLIKIDTRNNFAVTLGEKLETASCWSCTAYLSGVLLDDYYVSWEKDYVVLYPRDGSKPEIIQFKEYYEGMACRMIGDGDRLFLSYGQYAGYKKPGTLLEYNVKTKEKKVLVSTLDKTVKWPLQGLMDWPYHILSLTMDAKHHRILTMLHTGAFRWGRPAPPMKVYAYYWESEKWEAVSDEVPIYVGNNGKIFVEGDKIFLLDNWASYNRSGVIMPDGSWQLEMQLIKGKFDNNEQKWPDNRQFRIDYSHAFMPESNNDCECEGQFVLRFNGVLLGNNALLIPCEKLFYRFTERISPWAVFDDKYVIEWVRPPGAESTTLQIGVLKGIDQLKREAEQSRCPAP